jgi:hypothetical protein
MISGKRTGTSHEIIGKTQSISEKISDVSLCRIHETTLDSLQKLHYVLYDLLYSMTSHLEDVDHLIGGLPGLPRQL